MLQQLAEINESFCEVLLQLDDSVWQVIENPVKSAITAIPVLFNPS